MATQMRVLVAISEPVDGRKGIDSTPRLCRRSSPAKIHSSGCTCSCFAAARGTAIRLLSYDGQGYWLAQKRLSKGRFIWWPESGLAAKALEAYKAHLVDGGDLSRVRAAPVWRRVNAIK